jgi:hypothetical protein
MLFLPCFNFCKRSCEVRGAGAAFANPTSPIAAFSFSATFSFRLSFTFSFPFAPKLRTVFAEGMAVAEERMEEEGALEVEGEERMARRLEDCEPKRGLAVVDVVDLLSGAPACPN